MLETELTGLTRAHVVERVAPSYAAQPAVVIAFERLRDAAAGDGFDLYPVSSFRDFRTQLRIWNQKFDGQKPLFDIRGVQRNRHGMSEAQVIEHILNWSALPGGSRHHWGTEIDVIDRASVPSDYKAKLLPGEVFPGGPFERLHRWLDIHLTEFGFFRPYNYFQPTGGQGPSGEARGGMFPEPWHLSYAPLSTNILPELTVDVLRRAISGAEMKGKEYVLEHLDDLHRCHIRNIVRPNFQRRVDDEDFALTRVLQRF